MSLIEIHNVTKTFVGAAEEVTPLSDLSFRVEEGEFVALMGPSGSGKTTLLNLMASSIDTSRRPSAVIAGQVKKRSSRAASEAPTTIQASRRRDPGASFTGPAPAV